MAQAGTVAVILPGAFYFIRETRKPPIELFRRHGVRMAVATDCNPGTSPLTSLLLAMNMAATLFGMTVEECLAGVTREAARALGLAAETGTLEAGKWADLAIWDVESPAELVYRMGFNPLHAPCLERPMKPLVLKPGAVSLAELRAIYEGALPSLDESCRDKIAAAAGVIAKIVDKGDPVYGINTGFGKLASVRIASQDVETLQRNLILSHCCGVGAPLARKSSGLSWR